MGRMTSVEWDIINARVAHYVTRLNLSNKSLGFLHLVLEQFFPNKVGDFSDIITDGSNDRGIDAIEIIGNNEQAEIYIFQSKYRESISTTDKTINETEILKIITFLHEVFDKSIILTTHCNIQLREAIHRIWDLHEKGVFCNYRVVLCSNDQGISPAAQNIIESTSTNLPNVIFEYYGASELLRDFGAKGHGIETGQLQVMGKEILERIDGDIRGVIASIDARSFVDLITTTDGQSVKRHLFNDNLRIFLGESGGFNGAIIAAASSQDSHLFWYLNNGITITCRDYSFNKGHANPKIRLDDFQIVNGAQTSHSLLIAANNSPESLENVVLTVRVYATRRKDIIERVAVATNSQARIQSRDLKSNHPTLKKLEMAFLDRGYYFERKRNMHSDQDQKQRIDALKLGQIIMSYYLREPDRARTDSDSIFDTQFNRIFNEQHNVDELCKLFEIYQNIEDMRDAYTNNFGKNIEAGGDHMYLIYGNWFILYAIRLLVASYGNRLPSPDQYRNLIDNAINLVSRACSQGKSVAHYQMFRSSKTKDKILAEISEKQMSLFDILQTMDL